MNDLRYDAFLICPPGLEPYLLAEAEELGLAGMSIVPGGIEVRLDWDEMQLANLWLRSATRVLVRLGSFRVFHLAQLDKRARKFAWGDWLRKDVPVRVEVTCRKSKIYHAGAATQRIERALTEAAGISVSAEASVTLKIRIEDDLCTISLDTSGAPLHKRGYKVAVGKAPLRESMAAALLRAGGYKPGMPVVDPMCGSGTFPIEAAQAGCGIAPGALRAFAFEDLAGFDAEGWDALRQTTPKQSNARYYGFDRDDGAVRNSIANADRAGVLDYCQFARRPISELKAPDGLPGLVICNPPYGARIGNKGPLYALYGTLGVRLRTGGFEGWRFGMVTSDAGLAKSTGLTFEALGPPIAHGGLKVHLYRCQL